MATQETENLLNFGMNPDASGDVYPSTIAAEVTLSNAPGLEKCLVLPAAATISVDTGFHSSFRVPPDYVGTPRWIFEGILNGAPSSLVLAVGLQLTPLATSGAYDVALGTANLHNDSSVAEADLDVYIRDFSIADTLVAGQKCGYFFFVDDSVHTYTGEIDLTGCYLQYSDV